MVIPGIILVRKPENITTHDVILKLRKKIKTKIGHSGTIDKIGSGLVIATISTATKFTALFQNLDKEYIFTAVLGQATDTFDRTGRVVKKLTDNELTSLNISRSKIDEVLLQFTGKLDQKIPIFSAKRIDGQRAYKYALKNAKIDLPKKQINVYKLEVLEFQFPKLILRACVSAGTYIRSLVDDIGCVLGCGAYVEDIKRVRIGNFSNDNAVEVEKLLSLPYEEVEKYIIPLEKALDFLDRIEISLKESIIFSNGGSLNLYSNYKEGLLLRVIGNGNFLGIGKVIGTNQRLRLKPEIVLRS